MENLHDGHRQRMYDLIKNNGVDALNELNVLEYVLTIFLPRKDTNPIAHRLLNEFGTFANVLDSDIESLKKIEGIGNRTAIMIHSLPELFQFYKKNKVSGKTKINNYKDIEKYYNALLGSKPYEELYMTALNGNSEVIISKKISSGDNKSVEISNRDISQFIVHFSPASVIIGHCHPDAEPTPSFEDLKATKQIKKILELLDVTLVDHVIIGKDSSFSFFKNNILEEI